MILLLKRGNQSKQQLKHKWGIPYNKKLRMMKTRLIVSKRRKWSSVSTYKSHESLLVKAASLTCNPLKKSSPYHIQTLSFLNQSERITPTLRRARPSSRIWKFSMKLHPKWSLNLCKITIQLMLYRHCMDSGIWTICLQKLLIPAT